MITPTTMTTQKTPKTPHTAKPILRSAPILHTAKLSDELTRSMKRPTRRTLALIDKALAWLRPFESPSAKTTSAYEKRELLEFLAAHRTVLSPYIDTDRIEWNLRRGF